MTNYTTKVPHFYKVFTNSLRQMWRLAFATMWRVATVIGLLTFMYICGVIKTFRDHDRAVKDVSNALKH